MEARKVKPFPWMCADCREKTVLPVQREYSLPALHDGTTYELTIRDMLIPTCSRCGLAIITSEICERISAELRRAAGIMTPEEIRFNREKLGMLGAQLAAALRVDEATLTRWE